MIEPVPKFTFGPHVAYDAELTDPMRPTYIALTSPLSDNDESERGMEYVDTIDVEYTQAYEWTRDDQLVVPTDEPEIENVHVDVERMGSNGRAFFGVVDGPDMLLYELDVSARLLVPAVKAREVYGPCDMDDDTIQRDGDHYSGSVSRSLELFLYRIEPDTSL